ncbi:hypothetical protein [Prosthecodimorpha staleyi]|uniref:Secreted protein n=1 Tax=Prosthecodimorpha staleyi TaxID=2840188 RepID=A0A947D0P8_9HYPH|nr:hypothetical protein [Prosthecodimorpha staleyi]MBT9288204.1 hypothetical protein [Prosthecodimorpha staleyi]
MSLARPLSVLTATCLSGLAAATLAGTAAHAEVREQRPPCTPSATASCLPLTITLAAPDGWREDVAESGRRGVQVFLPKGSSFRDAPALIYAKVRPNASGVDLKAWLANSNAKWVVAHPDARIEPIETVAARPGIGTVAIERYVSPSLRDQPAELSATFFESAPDGRSYSVQLVLSGLSEKAVAGAVPAFKAMLASYAGANPTRP